MLRIGRLLVLTVRLGNGRRKDDAAANNRRRPRRGRERERDFVAVAVVVATRGIVGEVAKFFASWRNRHGGRPHHGVMVMVLTVDSELSELRKIKL